MRSQCNTALCAQHIRKSSLLQAWRDPPPLSFALFYE
jgi:hypothetical protein